jgi:hypothetical protein
MRFRGGLSNGTHPTDRNLLGVDPGATWPRIPYSTHPNINHGWFRATLTTHDALVMYKNHTPSETVATRTPGVEVRTSTIRTVSKNDDSNTKYIHSTPDLAVSNKLECVCVVFFESEYYPIGEHEGFKGTRGRPDSGHSSSASASRARPLSLRSRFSLPFTRLLS